MFNKIYGYFRYRKIIKENLEILSQRYRFKYDRLYGRLYTVLSITEERQEVLRTYGYDYLDNEVRKYVSSIEQYFQSVGMIDIISISKIDRIDPVNVLIVLRYKYKTHQLILYITLGLLSLIGGIAAITGIVKLIMLLINFIIAL